MRIVGLLIVMVLVMMGVTNGGDLSHIVDVPSLIIVAGVTLGLCLQGGLPLGMVAKSLFGAEYQGAELRAVIQAWQHLRTYVMATGVLGALIGAINMFQNLDDYAAFFPGTATAVITIFYAMILSYFVFLPLQHRLEKQLDSE
jgi:flagellar motor component MotA